MSDLELAVRWAKAVVIVAVAIWELVQLARRRDDIPLRVLVLGLVCLAWAATMGIKTPLLDPVQDFFGDSWSHIINGCWMTMACCFALYFLLANPALPFVRRQRKALLEFGVLLVMLIIMVATRELSPPEMWDRPRSIEDYRSPWNIAWYLSVDGYAVTAWFVGVRRAGALRRRRRNPWARAAFWLVMAGSSAMALGVNGISLLRTVLRCFDPAIARGGVFSALYSTGQLGGQFVLAIGLALVPLATAVVAARELRVRRQQSVHARQLEPLWRTLTTEFPYISLDPHGQPEVPDQSDRAFERRTAEITDGLAELARDCPAPEGDVRDPQVAADVIAAGLARRAERRDTGAEPDHQPPYPSLEPDFEGWRERARWMIAIGDDLRRRDVLATGERTRAG